MKILYADDAGNTGTDYDNPQQPYFSLLGIIVDSDKWHNLNNHFTTEKTKILPQFLDIEIHTSDIFNGKTIDGLNFRKLQGTTNIEVLEKIVDIIISLDIQIVTFTVKKQNLKNYCANKFKSQIKIDPYLIAFSYISRFFDDYMQSINEKGLIILDEQRALTDNIGHILKTFQICDDSQAVKINNIIETSLFLESKKSNFIQIADVCNYYINRYMTNILCNKDPEKSINQHVKRIYDKLQPKILNYDPLDYMDMLKFINNNFSL